MAAQEQAGTELKLANRLAGDDEVAPGGAQGVGGVAKLAVLPFVPGTLIKTGAALALVVRSPVRR